MVKATLSDGREVVILFSHHMNEERFKVPGPFANNAHAKGMTLARVVTGPKGRENTLAAGVAFFSVSEKVPYSREVGRRRALKRAVQELDWEDRVILLNAYRNRPRLAQSVQREEPTINTDY